MIAALAACTSSPPVVLPPVSEALVEPESRLVNSAGLIGEYFPAKAKGPAILFMGGSEGGLGEAARRDAVGLQAAGFSVLQISFYKGPGQPENLEMIPLETFDTANDWLKAQPEVDAARLGILGTSKGAEAALIVATRHPDLKAVVANVPSSMSWQGINWARDGRIPAASWSLGGVAVPALPYGAWDDSLGLISLYANGLKAVADHLDAVIRVETIKAPILLVCGEADTLWPSCEMSRQIASRAEAVGGPRVKLLAFKDAGHAVAGQPVENFDPATSKLGALGGTAEGNQLARQTSWPDVVAFFKSEL